MLCLAEQNLRAIPDKNVERSRSPPGPLNVFQYFFLVVRNADTLARGPILRHAVQIASAKRVDPYPRPAALLQHAQDHQFGKVRFALVQQNGLATEIKQPLSRPANENRMTYRQLTDSSA